jgi:DNA-binding MarR family transcriptional regulator
MTEPATPWTPLAQDVSLLPVIRQLLECHVQVDRVSNRLVEAQGLTMPQFDVIATLGDTAGMTCKELGAQSLTTKGSLLPILDRLEAKGLICRAKGEKDSRQTIVSLTDEGQALYQHVFPEFVTAMRARVDALSPADQAELIRLLQALKGAFS